MVPLGRWRDTFIYDASVLVLEGIRQKLVLLLPSGTRDVRVAFTHWPGVAFSPIFSSPGDPPSFPAGGGSGTGAASHPICVSFLPLCWDLNPGPDHC